MIYLIILFHLIISCGYPPKKDPAPESMIELIDERVESIRLWAPICQADVGNRPIPFVCKHPADGDAVLWNGLMCLVGKDFACNAVRESFSDNGKPNRSPYWRVTPRPENDFSRDMLMGFLAYLVKTKDIELAERFRIYVENNEYKLCTNATDSRCSLTPTTWGLMAYVWEYLGLPLWGNMPVSKSLYFTALRVQADATETGYPSHLIAAHIVICKYMQLSNFGIDAAISALYRLDPRNPLFILLKNGTSEQFALEMLTQMPESKPESDDLQWSTERFSEEKAWLRSVGWEFIYVWLLAKEMPLWTQKS